MADAKLTALTATTSIDGTELMYVVEDPAGTPLSRQVLASDVKTYMSAGVGGTPGGSNTQVQFNDGGVFGGDTALVWNKTTNVLTMGGNLLFTADNTQDIGAAGATRPRTVYAATSFVSGGGATLGTGTFLANAAGNANLYFGSGDLRLYGSGSSANVSIQGAGGSGFTQLHGSDYLGWGATTAESAGDLKLYRDGAAATLAQRNGVNAQTLRIYNTFTDASNYERLSIGWSGSLCTIKPENLGTGSARDLAVIGVATPAGGSTAARLIFGTTSGFGIYYGSGVPTVSAAQGSLYLRSDGSSTTTRLYVNTNGSTTWTNVTTAA